jgi:hypothetical protein
MLTICIASLDSENFHFDAIGLDEESAIENLRTGLRAHAKQYGLAADWWAEGYEISIRFMRSDAAYRDREEI